jgi:hypothetical protein
MADAGEKSARQKMWNSGSADVCHPIILATSAHGSAASNHGTAARSTPVFFTGIGPFTG